MQLVQQIIKITAHLQVVSNVVGVLIVGIKSTG